MRKPVSSSSGAPASGESVEHKSDSESKEELNLTACSEILLESYRRVKFQCNQHTESVSVLASLKKQEDALNEKQEKLLDKIEKLSRQIGDTLKTLQRLRDEKENMNLSLSDLQQQIRSLRSKIQDKETLLKVIRIQENDRRKSLHRAYCCTGTESIKKSALARLKKQEDALNEKQEKLLDNIEELSRQIGDTLKTLQRLQNETENMNLSLSHLQQQTRSLKSKIQDKVTQENDRKKSLHSAYCTGIQCIKKSEGVKREKLEAEGKRLAENLESEKAKRLKLEVNVKLSEQNLVSEKAKRIDVEKDLEIFQQNLELEKAFLLQIFEQDLELEKTKRLKLETDVKLSKQNLEREKSKRVRLEVDAKQLKQNLESEKAKRLKLEADMKLSKQNLETETIKRVRLEKDAKLFEDTLESERVKLLCSICEDKVRDTLILPCSHFQCCNVCILEHKQRNNTCPICRGYISAILLCQHSIS